ASPHEPRCARTSCVTFARRSRIGTKRSGVTAPTPRGARARAAKSWSICWILHPSRVKMVGSMAERPSSAEIERRKGKDADAPRDEGKGDRSGNGRVPAPAESEKKIRGGSSAPKTARGEPEAHAESEGAHPSIPPLPAAGPWRSYKEIVSQLAQRIVDGQRDIRVLQSIRWDNPVEEQFKKSRYRELPK